MEKLQRGGIDAVFLALAVGGGPRTPDGVAEARAEADEKLAAIRAFIAENAGNAAQALSAADIVRIKGEGKVAVLVSFLNARIVGRSIAAIDTMYANGVRLFGMAHSGNNDFTDSGRPTGEPKEEHGGLSPLGREAVAKLNSLGIIIDVSQLSTKALLQTAKLSKAPVIASHSGVRALVEHVRNLSDAELDAIRENGGTVHINLFNAYLVPMPADMPEKVRALRKRFGLDPDFPPPATFSSGYDKLPPEKRPMFDDSIAALYPKATVKDFVDHVDYVVKRIGIDHVGIGTDLNHGSGIQGYENEGDALNVTKELVRRGYTEEQIGKIWGGNFLRVFRAVVAAAGKKSG
jgi:membrane dipeptidase